MKVKGKVSVYYYETSMHEEVKLKVRFKLPNQKFHRSRDKTIANSWWRMGKDDYDYWQDAIEKLQSKEYLEQVAKDLIIEYIKEKFGETEYDKNKRKVNELIKSVEKNFEVEVDYDLSK